MTCSRSVFAIGLLAFLTCCKPPLPTGPTDEDVGKVVFAERLKSGIKISEIVHGETVLSEGRYCPTGKPIFPIRVRYAENRHSFYQKGGEWAMEIREVMFFKNPFGEWTFKDLPK